MRKSRLSDGEIVQIFREIKQNPEDSASRYRELMEGLSFIPKSLVAKYKGYPNYLDLKQTAEEVFFRSIITFDYCKSINFKGWCWWWVRKEVAKEALREKRYLSSHKLFEPDEDDQVCLQTGEDVYIGKQEKKQLNAAIASLPDSEREIIRKTFGINQRELSLRKVAQELDISHEQVRKIRDRAVKKLVVKMRPTNNLTKRHEYQ